MNRIITCGFSDNLIKNMADFAFENFLSKGVEPSRLCFVFGGRRPSLFLKKELAERSGGGMLSPAFFTMEDFMKEIVSQKGPVSFISDIEAAYLIYRLAKEKAPSMLGRRESFAEFLPWAYEILSFINRADMEGIEQKALLNVEANAEIGYDIPEKINELLKNINILREAFHASVSKRNELTRGLLYRSALIGAADFNIEKYDAVIFGNLFYLHRTEEEMVKAVYGTGKGVIFFQGDSAEWPVLKKLEKTFSCEIHPVRDTCNNAIGSNCETKNDKNISLEMTDRVTVQGRPISYVVKAKPENGPEISLYCGNDTHSQASIAKDIIAGIGTPEKSVLIIPDPDALMPVITSVTSVIEDFNVSLGYPVEKSSLFSLVEAVFNAQESRKGREYYTRDYLRVLLHPLVKNMRLPQDPGVTRLLMHKVEEVLTSDTEASVCGRLFINPDDVENEERVFLLSTESGVNAGIVELKDILSQLHRFFFDMWEGVKNFRDLNGKILSFSAMITERSFAAYYPLNSKAVEALMEIGAELKDSSFGDELLPSQDMLKILLRRLRDELVSFPGTPLKGFQVLGLLESRSLNFENVVVLNANESVLPKLKAAEPLIPREVMLGLGINRVEKEEEIQRYEFFRLIKGAKRAHIIYSGSEENERSRFIEELLWERQKKNNSFTLQASSYGFRAEPSPAKKVYDKLPEVSAFLKTMKYTVTNVNAYLDCPSRFYFRYVLRVKERELYTEEPGGSEIGRFIHDFLFKQFSAFIGQKPVFDTAFEKAFIGSLDSVFEEEFSGRMRAASFLVKEVVSHRMRQFLEKERERNPRKVIALEKKYAGNFEIGGQSYVFESRIDRIDELEDGGFLIIDYKTGGLEGIKARSNLPENVPFSRESIKKYVGSFQLPVYINLVQRQMNGARLDAALYDLKTAELLNFFKEPDEAYRKARTDFCAGALEFIISEINNPEIPFAPDNSNPQKCQSCPYFYMCR